MRFVNRSSPRERKHKTKMAVMIVVGPLPVCDFVKVGTPLTVICALVLLAPLIWQG
jgi:hypothetical protein